MAKTQWANGSFITPSYMQASSGIDATTGHSHDQLDADGSNPKINLTTEVSGELPLANVLNGADGTVAVKVTTSHLTVEQNFEILWEKHFNVVTLQIPAFSGTSNSNQLPLELDSGETWPADILPNGPSTPWYNLPCVVRNNNLDQPGALEINPTNPSSSWRLNCYDTTQILFSNFDSTGTKGIRRFSCSYMTQDP